MWKKEEITTFNAFWQYLVDHGKFTEHGLEVSLIIKSKHKLKGKIAARKKGYKHKTQ